MDVPVGDDHTRFFVSERIVPVYEKYNARGHYVAISDADRHPRLQIRRDDPSRYPDGRICSHAFDPLPDRRPLPALFFGRFHPDKGVVGGAWTLRKKPVSPLKLDRGNRSRTGNAISSSASSGPVIDGERDRVPRSRSDARIVRQSLLAGADALLHLINFDEPFGLSVVEADGLRHARPRASAWGRCPRLSTPGVNGEFLSASAEGDARRTLDSLDTLDRRQSARIGRNALQRRAHGERISRALRAQVLQSRAALNPTAVCEKRQFGGKLSLPRPTMSKNPSARSDSSVFKANSATWPTR